MIKQGDCAKCGKKTWRRRRIYAILRKVDWDKKAFSFDTIINGKHLILPVWQCWGCGGYMPGRLPHRGDKRTWNRLLHYIHNDLGIFDQRFHAEVKRILGT